MIATLPFTIADLAIAYADGLSPVAVVDEAFARLAAADDPGIFLHMDPQAARAAARALGPRPDGRPLWGIPFVVKDNIDVAGMPTTAACPDAAYLPETDAFVVARLREAGAIVLGKTNLDQFATGLVGVRTPGPVPRNALDPALVPGGSSSGSAVAVARGIAAFGLGTDTAGSGRVPAALNSIVGLKPTLGTLSARGMIPACRTLDTISVFAQTVAEAWAIYRVAARPDPEDAYSRPAPDGPLVAVPRVRIGVPDATTLALCDPEQAEDFRATTARLAALGLEVAEIDFAPFLAVARMLYEGAWLAERVAAVGARLTEAPQTLHPVTRAILEPGLGLTAVDAFLGAYRLQALKAEALRAMEGCHALAVPSVPGEVTLEQIAADPIGPNARLGTFTNFVNLLDLCGIAVPTGDRPDGRPGGITVLAPAFRDSLAAGIAVGIEGGRMGATGHLRIPNPLPADALPDEIALAVCGAHMTGLPLNGELTALGARFLRACLTAPGYRLHALSGGPPRRPGLVRDPEEGAAIAVEVWALPRKALGAFVAGIPAPLCIGSVSLEDGSVVKGFLCETAGLSGASEITHLCGWRAFLAEAAQ